jgi:hypothetical protein
LGTPPPTAPAGTARAMTAITAPSVHELRLEKKVQDMQATLRVAVPQ